jgi:3-hydroxyisobutyrate dehydrogenase-like beta-hydroxyacid dehydrogenase
MIESLGETAAHMRKCEVDPKRFLEIMTETLFAAPVYRIYRGLIAEEKYQPARFKMEFGLKDMRSVLAAAEAKGAPMAVGSILGDRFCGIARDGGELDWSAIERVVAEDAGPNS